jgi:hypothetical protein
MTMGKRGPRFRSSGDSRFLRERLEAVIADVDAAREANSWQAVMAGHSRTLEIGKQLRQQLDIEANRKPKRAPTPEEQQAAEEQHAHEITDPHLQVYMVEYLTRNPTLRLVTDDGTPITLLRAS